MWPVATVLVRKRTPFSAQKEHFLQPPYTCTRVLPGASSAQAGLVLSFPCIFRIFFSQPGHPSPPASSSNHPCLCSLLQSLSLPHPPWAPEISASDFLMPGVCASSWVTFLWHSLTSPTQQYRKETHAAWLIEGKDKSVTWKSTIKHDFVPTSICHSWLHSSIQLSAQGLLSFRGKRNCEQVPPVPSRWSYPVALGEGFTLNLNVLCCEKCPLIPDVLPWRACHQDWECRSKGLHMIWKALNYKKVAGKLGNVHPCCVTLT